MVDVKFYVFFVSESNEITKTKSFHSNFTENRFLRNKDFLCFYAQHQSIIEHIKVSIDRETFPFKSFAPEEL